MNIIPATNQFIDSAQNEPDLQNIDKTVLTKYIRKYIKALKENTSPLPESKQIILEQFIAHLKNILSPPIKPVINATGIILHTNLGRAPISEVQFNKLKKNIKYTNIEFDLASGKRAYRDNYLKDIFSFITGSDDVVVVNNNAAALFLIIKTFCIDKKEIIISRGELIEIGGSFRIPDILKEAGATLKEVGTTNCTRLSDYENAITENTAMILKAHTSNFSIQGYTEVTSVDELVNLANKKNIPFVYDAGSGLIKKPMLIKDINEKTIPEYLDLGVDVICFSGDKILGGTQAGIILGKKEYLAPLKKNPLMRVLRADKLTICSLFHQISMYKNEKELIENNVVYSLLSQSDEQIKEKAEILAELLNNNNIENSIHEVEAFSGGGTLPDKSFKSYEVRINLKKHSMTEEELYYKFLSLDKPIVAVLRERKLFVNVFTVDKDEIKYIADMAHKFV